MPATTQDWDERYYHVNQILEKPGPRTDPDFLAGDEVRATPLCDHTVASSSHIGEGVLTQEVQDPCYRRGWAWMRDPCQSCFDWLQGHPCNRHGHN